MNIVDQIVGFFSAKAAFKRARYRAAASMIRKYEGASKTRRTSGWKASSSSAASEIRQSLTTLRNRSRQLVRDNPYAARAVQVVASNVVGKGIFTQIKVDSGQNQRNRFAERRESELSRQWKAWANTKAIDFDERQNLLSMQDLVIRSVVESGEVLVRRRSVGRRVIETPDGSIEVPNLQIQILESDFLDSTSVSSRSEQDNVIIDGIEFDSQGRRVAYHLFQEHPGNTSLNFNFRSAFRTFRVPADEILHIHRMDRPGQIRGAPWLSPVLIRMKDFDEYEDAQLVRQKVAAMFAAFIRDLDGIDTQVKIKEGELGEKVEPGIMEFLPPGKDISFANPPTVENYNEYTSVLLHAIASGVGITYESMTGDLSQVNFSSARMGFLEMQRNVESWRNNLIIAQFLLGVFTWWKRGIELLGVDTRRMRPVWTPPRREMIDPTKETSAMKESVRSGFSTLSEIIRNQGADPEEHLNEIQSDNQKLDERGLILSTDPRNDPQRIMTP